MIDLGLETELADRFQAKKRGNIFVFINVSAQV